MVRRQIAGRSLEYGRVLLRAFLRNGFGHFLRNRFGYFLRARSRYLFPFCQHLICGPAGALAGFEIAQYTVRALQSPSYNILAAIFFPDPVLNIIVVDILADILLEVRGKFKCLPVKNHQRDIHLLIFQKRRNLVKGDVQSLVSRKAVGSR